MMWPFRRPLRHPCVVLQRGTANLAGTADGELDADGAHDLHDKGSGGDDIDDQKAELLALVTERGKPACRGESQADGDTGLRQEAEAEVVAYRLLGTADSSAQPRAAELASTAQQDVGDAEQTHRRQE
jgi:hypothetical protein